MNQKVTSSVIKYEFIGYNSHSRPMTKLTAVKKLVIHYTANPGATARNHKTYFANLSDRSASAHIFVDKNEAICIIPLDEVAYHAGDVQKRNANGTPYRGVKELLPSANSLSIGVELCIEKDGTFHPDTLKLAEQVFADLCKAYELDPIDDIVRHYDVTAKNCPAPFVSNVTAYNNFKNGVKTKLNPVKNGWLKENNVWYYYIDGNKKTGWLEYKEKWYYLDSDGSMKTGWVKSNNNWFYLDNEGVMKTGWVQVDNKWYYLNKDGSMKTGWLQEGEKWYFLNESGVMAVGFNIINNKPYYFESNGVLVQSKDINLKADENGVIS